MKNSFIEMEEKTNKKLEEINKCLKENKEKAIKRVKERIQDLNTEIKAIKKTQTEGIMGMENVAKRSGTKNTSISSRIQEMKEKISSIEDMIDEIDSPVKENIKSIKSLTQNIQEISHTKKRQNLRMKEGEELQLKGPETFPT